MAVKLRIEWSNRSILDLNSVYNYLKENWTIKEAEIFLDLTQEFLNLIQHYREVFPGSQKIKSCRLGLIHKNVSIVYKVEKTKFLLLHFLTIDQNLSIVNT